MPGSRHLRPAYSVQRVRQTPHGVQPPCMGWCSPPSPVPTGQNPTTSPHPHLPRSGRTISGICFIYKLMCGPHVPCLQPLLPRRSTQDPLPRTRQASPDRKWPQLSAFFNSTAPIAVRRSFPYLYIPIWNFLPPPPPKRSARAESEAASAFQSRSQQQSTSTYLKTTGSGQSKLTLSTPPNYELLIYTGTTTFCFLLFPPSPLHCP